eukprot:TRINITY_DN34539_c0_g1_i1.p1 TRINITY_DN34539_c0_g1~~TRINITY_DN34539_c0_g1_i1.p1  ORF type:complete len:335 (+),score=62.16 TRINITY_DN34539_c0_g1_i1:42-1046(+)
MPHPGHKDPMAWRPPTWIDAQHRNGGATSSKSDEYFRRVSDVEACAEAARAMVGFCLKACETMDNDHMRGLLTAADTGMKELQDRIKPLYSIDIGATNSSNTSNSGCLAAAWQTEDSYERKHLADTKAQVAGEAAQLVATTAAAERLAGERRKHRHTEPEPPPPPPSTPATAGTPARVAALPWLDSDEVNSASGDDFHNMIGALEQRYQKVKSQPDQHQHKISQQYQPSPKPQARTRTPSPALKKSPMVQNLVTPPQQTPTMHWKPTPGSGPKTFTLRFDDDDYEDRRERRTATKRSTSTANARCLSPQGPRCVSPQNRVSPAHRRPSPVKRWR